MTACTCGRVGTCSTCCCGYFEHRARPDKACSLCGHVGVLDPSASKEVES